MNTDERTINSISFQSTDLEGYQKMTSKGIFNKKIVKIGKHEYIYIAEMKFEI